MSRLTEGLTGWLHRAMYIVRRRRFERDLDEEIELHLDLLARDRETGGLAGDEARIGALRAFGNPTRLKETSVMAWQLPWLEVLLQDTRYGFRSLRRNPAFAATAIISLALGIGANVTIFRAAWSVLFQPLPYQNADRLVWLAGRNPARHWNNNPVSGPVMRAWQERNHVFADVALFQPDRVRTMADGEPALLPIQYATINLLPLLGAHVVIGRDFAPDDAIPGGPIRVILSHSYWERQFAADSSIAGKAIAFNDTIATIVGVLSPGFDDRYAWSTPGGTDFWIAMPVSAARGDNEFSVIARLKPNVTLADVDRDMDDVSRQIEADDPEQRGWRVAVTALRDHIAGSSKDALLLLLAATLFITLIGCANLANLLLARGAAREREIALRSVLGAGRGRIVRQLMTEGALLGLTSGVLGIALGFSGSRLLNAIAPQAAQGLGRWRDVAVVTGYAVGMLALVIIAFGLAPAISGSRIAARAAVDVGGRGSTRGPSHTRASGSLIVVEFALALMLVVGAGLMLRTLSAVNRVPLGVDADHVVTMWVALGSRRYDDPQTYVSFWRDLLARVSAVPGVEAATVTRGLPMQGWSGAPFVALDRPRPVPGQRPVANEVVISPDYFRVMRLPLLAGRAFTESDHERAPRVVIVSEELAATTWPGQSALGRLIASPTADSLPRTVVGVAADVHTQGLTVPVRPEMYIPYTQVSRRGYRGKQLAIRTTGGAGAVVTAVRRAVAAIDPALNVADVRPLGDIIGQREAQRRMLSALLLSFAALSLGLAAIGIYGVVAYGVAQRTREFGVRIALGAGRADIVVAVVQTVFRLALGGIALGVLGALGLTRYLSALLFGVQATDPGTFVSVALLLTAVAVAAAAVPARRATRVDPATTLRAD